MPRLFARAWDLLTAWLAWRTPSEPSAEDLARMDWPTSTRRMGVRLDAGGPRRPRLQLRLPPSAVDGDAGPSETGDGDGGQP